MKINTCQVVISYRNKSRVKEQLLTDGVVCTILESVSWSKVL